MSKYQAPVTIEDLKGVITITWISRKEAKLLVVVDLLQDLIGYEVKYKKNETEESSHFWNLTEALDKLNSY